MDFPHYGLAARWAGQRWLSIVIGDGVCLWLGHARPEQNLGAFVGTIPRQRLDLWRARLPQHPDGRTAAASIGCEKLVNLVFHDGPRPRPLGGGWAMVEHVMGQAARSADWPTVRWSVGSGTVNAQVWHFAGAWVGITTDLEDTYLTAVGVGIDPAELRLELVADDSAYGFEALQPDSEAERPVRITRSRPPSGSLLSQLA